MPVWISKVCSCMHQLQCYCPAEVKSGIDVSLCCNIGQEMVLNKSSHPCRLGMVTTGQHQNCSRGHRCHLFGGLQVSGSTRGIHSCVIESSRNHRSLEALQPPCSELKCSPRTQWCSYSQGSLNQHWQWIALIPAVNPFKGFDQLWMRLNEMNHELMKSKGDMPVLIRGRVIAGCKVGHMLVCSTCRGIFDMDSPSWLMVVPFGIAWALWWALINFHACISWVTPG